MISSYSREPAEQCQRCGMQYKESELACPHCRGKTSAEIIRDIHIPHAERLEKTGSIGRVFIYLAIITACLFLLLL